jgi:hypothetical protein
MKYRKAAVVAIVLFVVATLVVVIFTVFSFINHGNSVQAHFGKENYISTQMKESFLMSDFLRWSENMYVSIYNNTYSSGLFQEGCGSFQIAGEANFIHLFCNFNADLDKEYINKFSKLVNSQEFKDKFSELKNLDYEFNNEVLTFTVAYEDKDISVGLEKYVHSWSTKINPEEIGLESFRKIYDSLNKCKNNEFGQINDCISQKLKNFEVSTEQVIDFSGKTNLIKVVLTSKKKDFVVEGQPQNIVMKFFIENQQYSQEAISH